MRDSFALAPFPIWVTDQNHVVLWANDRYRALQISAGRDSDFCVLDTGLALPQNDAPVAVRVKMEPNANDQGSASWFNVVVRRMPNFWLYYATDVSEVVKAEKAQLSFVQTLTKTFAALDTGFAIFDHERRLTMFNPALVALTRINPEVLSARPTLSAFLDSLRDANMVPEPKDYKSWRKRLSSLASDDDKRTGYEETWSLADGTTFRVTGWPYPNGAVAFLFKDITDEVTAIHRLHSALSIGQSALDCFDEAICIISRQGKLLLANADYHALFGSDPAHVREISILQILRDWEKTLKPGPIGRAMTDSGGSFPTRQDFVSREETRDGRTLTCRVSPLMAGATLCRFSAEPEIALMKAP